MRRDHRRRGARIHAHRVPTRRRWKTTKKKVILATALTQPSPRYACRLSISPMVEAAPQLGKASPTLKHAGSTFGVGARVDGPLVAESI